MNKLIIILLVFNCITACNNKKDKQAIAPQKFDKIKWQQKDGNAYPYRQAMVDHLRDSVNIKNIPYDSLMKLLGPPDRVNEGHLYYDIYKKEVGMVTFGTQAFVIKLKPDSTVEWRKTYGR